MRRNVAKLELITLLDAHKAAGYPGVLRAHPAFARFVHHIYSYVVAQAEKKKSAKKIKRQDETVARRNRKPPPPLHPPSEFEVAAAEIAHLPFDLYGLRDGTSKRRVTLQLPAKRCALDNKEAIYSCAKKIDLGPAQRTPDEAKSADPHVHPETIEYEHFHRP